MVEDTLKKKKKTTMQVLLLRQAAKYLQHDTLELIWHSWYSVQRNVTIAHGHNAKPVLKGYILQPRSINHQNCFGRCHLVLFHYYVTLLFIKCFDYQQTVRQNLCEIEVPQMKFSIMGSVFWLHVIPSSFSWSFTHLEKIRTSTCR